MAQNEITAFAFIISRKKSQDSFAVYSLKALMSVLTKDVFIYNNYIIKLSSKIKLNC